MVHRQRPEMLHKGTLNAYSPEEIPLRRETVREHCGTRHRYRPPQKPLVVL